MHLKEARSLSPPPRTIFLVIAPMISAFSCGLSSPSPRTPAAETSKNEPPLDEKATEQPVTGDFLLKDIDGNSHALSDYLGKQIIVVTCFAVWCEPCRAELAALEKLYNTYKDRNVTVLALSMDLPETREEVRPLAKELGLTFPVLLDEELKGADLFNPQRNTPFSAVIDMNRNRIWSHMGYVPGDEKELESVILSALEKLPAASKENADGL
jgi:peroxiredoxin